MERDNLNLISKKQRINSAMTEDNPNLTGEGSSRVVESASATRNLVDYRLYFKGLVSDEPTSNMEKTVKAGYGVAICHEADTLLYEMKKSIYGAIINREEVEYIALISGLNESIQLGLRNILICCDDLQIYQIIIGKDKPMQKVARLVEEVEHLREKFASTQVVLVMPNDVNFAFNLAIEAILSPSSSSSVDVKAPQGESSIDVKAPQEETCAICIEETDVEFMFFTGKCFHRYCFSCVKHHVEVKLLSGMVPTCLDYGCNSELTLESCSKVLTPKLIDMWKQKMEEDLILAADKIYCPYPSCSMLMSKASLSSGANQSSVRACVKCCGLFCIECKVPSHPDLSCNDYKKLFSETLDDDMKLKSLAEDNKWRQCVKCRHLIERYFGCNHMTCRCGYEFCYQCGFEWKPNQRGCPSGCRFTEDEDTDEDFDVDDEDDSDDSDSDYYEDDDDGDDDNDDGAGSNYSIGEH